MKIMMVWVVLFFLSLPNAYSESFEELLFNSDKGSLDNIKASVEISQQGILYAKLLLRKVKGHGTRCDFTPNASSSRGCNIERFDVYIPRLTEENDIVYYVKGDKTIVCGYVHDSWGKQMVELYDNCRINKFQGYDSNTVVFRAED